MMLLANIDRRGRTPLTRSTMVRMQRLLSRWLYASVETRLRIEAILARAGVTAPA